MTARVKRKELSLPPADCTAHATEARPLSAGNSPSWTVLCPAGETSPSKRTAKREQAQECRSLEADVCDDGKGCCDHRDVCDDASCNASCVEIVCCDDDHASEGGGFSYDLHRAYAHTGKDDMHCERMNTCTDCFSYCNDCNWALPSQIDGSDGRAVVYCHDFATACHTPHTYDQQYLFCEGPLGNEASYKCHSRVCHNHAYSCVPAGPGLACVETECDNAQCPVECSGGSSVLRHSVGSARSGPGVSAEEEHCDINHDPAGSVPGDNYYHTPRDSFLTPNSRDSFHSTSTPTNTTATTATTTYQNKDLYRYIEWSPAVSAHSSLSTVPDEPMVKSCCDKISRRKMHDDHHERPVQTSFDAERHSTEDDELFHCHWDSCQMAFGTELEFDAHMIDEHVAVLQDAVQQDKMVMDVLAGQKQAVPPADTVMGAEPKLQCQWDHCGTLASEYTDLQDHVRKHWQDKQGHVPEHHQCLWTVSEDCGAAEGESEHVCGQCFGTTEELSAHVVKEHVGKGKSKYTCTWSGCTRNRRPFTQRQKILRHLQVHTQYRPFVCDICGHRFGEVHAMTQHRRTHTGERPYKCAECDKRFTTAASLSAHMRVHKDLRPRACPVPDCGKRFGDASNLLKHLRTHMRKKQRMKLKMETFDVMQAQNTGQTPQDTKDM